MTRARGMSQWVALLPTDPDRRDTTEFDATRLDTIENRSTLNTRTKINDPRRDH